MCLCDGFLTIQNNCTRDIDAIRTRLMSKFVSSLCFGGRDWRTSMKDFKLWDNLDTMHVPIGKKRKGCCGRKLLENCCYLRCFMKAMDHIFSGFTYIHAYIHANKPLWDVKRTSACKWKWSSYLKVILLGVLSPQNQSCVCWKLLLKTTGSLAGFPWPRTIGQHNAQHNFMWQTSGFKGTRFCLIWKLFVQKVIPRDCTCLSENYRWFFFVT